MTTTVSQMSNPLIFTDNPEAIVARDEANSPVQLRDPEATLAVLVGLQTEPGTGRFS